MSIKKKIVLILIVLSISRLYGQNLTSSYQLNKYISNLGFEDKPSRFIDIENTLQYKIWNQTSMLDWYLNLTEHNIGFSKIKKEERNILLFSFQNLHNQGDYIPYKGSSKMQSSVFAGGHKTVQKKGSLFGYSSYRRKLINDIRYNYAIYPDLYEPYFVGDSISKEEVNQELYTIGGGYSFSNGSWNYGVDATYEGVAQSRSKNPRHSNYSHWLKIGLNISKIQPRSIIGIKIYPETNIQSISANAQINPVKIFQFYGLGQWNQRESKSSLSYGRIQKMRGIGGALLYLYNGQWDLLTEASYNYRTIYTEETSMKNLFSATTQHLKQDIYAERKFKKGTLHLQLTTYQNFKQGTEKVYENQVQDSEQNLYDYTLIGSNELYTQQWYDTELRGKFIFTLTPKSHLHIMSSVKYCYFEEKYRFPFLSTTTNSITPSIILGFQQLKKKSFWECYLSASFFKSLNDTYQTTVNENIIEELVFTPHLLKSTDRNTISTQVSYTHNIKKNCKVGIRGCYSYQNSKYRTINRLKADLFLIF